MSALTYPEAQQRSQLIDVFRYHVELDLAGQGDTFGSVTVVGFGCRAPGADSFIELTPARLRQAVLNGRVLDPGTLRDGRLPLTGLAAVNELRVEADMAYVSAGPGLNRFIDVPDGETYLTLQGGLGNAPRVFAAFDQPDLKAVMAATVTVPEHWSVIGNARARAAGAGRWELAATPPMSSYLFTVVAGPYVSIGAEHQGIPFGLHARRSLASALHRDAGEILAITQACFDRYREIFTEPYPYDSYDQAFVPELESGAEENPGCVTFRDEFLFPSAATRSERQIRAVVIGHEMAHMWFGDLVTMRWWNDVWLSESFAEFMGFEVVSRATAFTAAWTDFALVRKTRGYDADQRGSSHPVAPEPSGVTDTDAARSAYDDISYAKGAAALRQLVAHLGWPAFEAGLNDYIARYRFASATLPDLLECLSQASGTDVSEWAAAWLGTTGVDTVAVTRPEPPGRVSCLTHAGQRPHQLMLGVYDEEHGRLTLRARIPVTAPADASAVVLPAVAGQPEPALLLPNDGDHTYAKVRLDPVSLATVRTSLGTIPDPLSRAVAWNTVRDLVRDAELAPRVYLDLAVRHLAAETDGSIAEHVTGYARWTVADCYLAPQRREQALADLTGVGWDLLHGTGPGGPGGLRLVAARVLIDSASSPEDISVLWSWLAGGQVPGGPDLDAGMRWRILLRLSVLGAAGRAWIEEEASRDATASGQLSAARCRAALPDEAAKRQAWEAMLDGAASGYQLAATARGFWHAEQAGLLAEYLPHYFPALAGLAARRGPALARVLCQHGFPRFATDDDTVQAGEQCLRTAGLSESLRRLLGDQLDDLRRARRVRSASQAQ